MVAVPLLFLTAACSGTDEPAAESGVASVTAGAASSTSCGADVEAIPEPERQINLVLDESGSMFVDGAGAPETLWSMAKYSLEVFAALIAERDVLNVYPMSYYGPSSSSEPTLTLSGDQAATDRVATVHDYNLNGGSTPWRSMTAAAEDIASSTAEERWLVILTDGEFVDGTRPVPSLEVAGLLDDLASQGIQIAFMSVGAEAVEIPQAETRQVARVNGGTDLLDGMTVFANQIFGRSVVRVTGSEAAWTTDIPMEEVVLFAQGPDVRIGDAQAASGAIGPTDAVDVRWTTNENIQVKGPDGNVLQIVPLPDESLQGSLATFRDVPAGDVAFDVQDAQVLDVFYKPQVEFGYTISDEQGIDVGNVLTAGQPYVLNYSFMDAACVPVQSDLLEPVEYSAQILDGERVVEEDLPPGAPLDLPPASYTLRVAASFTGGTAAAEIPLIVNASASLRDYQASEMAEYPTVEDGIPFPITVLEGGPGGLSRPLTESEWAAFDPLAVTYESSANLEYLMVKGPRPGDATILVRAPSGDVYAAGTGDVNVRITIPTQGELEGLTSAPVRFSVADDISPVERFLHWFWTVGIWILLVIAFLVILLGYLLKKRFPRKIKQKPTIEGVPRVIGQSRLNGKGQFQVNGFRKLLPFVADTATLKYVPPGTIGFTSMRLKAGPRKMLRLTNWKAIAKQENVHINGGPLDATTTKEPIFGASAMITADTPQMTYEMTPTQ